MINFLWLNNISVDLSLEDRRVQSTFRSPVGVMSEISMKRGIAQVYKPGISETTYYFFKTGVLYLF